MHLIINGKAEQLDTASDGTLNVSQLLVKKKVEMPDMVSVQLNGEFVKNAHYTSQKLTDGDQIEFLYFMGGGL